MITEDYVSFEIAKFLKERGFNEPCEGFYVNSGVLSHTLSNANNSKCDEDKSTIGYISAPTLQMAMKWLRQVHNIHVVPKFDFYAGDYTGRIYDGRRETVSERDDYIAITGYRTYEEACETAIKYCLKNLILAITD